MPRCPIAYHAAVICLSCQCGEISDAGSRVNQIHQCNVSYRCKSCHWHHKNTNTVIFLIYEYKKTYIYDSLILIKPIYMKKRRKILMSKVFITGDTHRKTDIEKIYVHQFPQQKEMTKDDIFIIAGDAGIITKIIRL